MKPLFSYTGSKRNELHHIEPHFAPHSTFVDVFGGGGSVLLSRIGRSAQLHFNDINPTIVNIFTIMSNTDEAQRFHDYLDSIDMGIDEIKAYIREPDPPVCEEALFLLRGRVCLMGFRSTNTLKTTTSDRNIYLGTLADKFKVREFAKQFAQANVKITNLDYKEVLESYRNDPNALLYLDPPYISKRHNQYDVTFGTADLLFIRDFMSACKCNVMLNIDYLGWTRETFAKYFRVGYPVRYNTRSYHKGVNATQSANVYGKWHLIAANYGDLEKTM